jgi:hypothetical protein
MCPGPPPHLTQTCCGQFISTAALVGLQRMCHSLSSLHLDLLGASDRLCDAIPGLVAANTGLVSLGLEHAEAVTVEVLTRMLDAGPGLHTLQVTGFVDRPEGYRRALDRRSALTCLRCVTVH